MMLNMQISDGYLDMDKILITIESYNQSANKFSQMFQNNGDYQELIKEFSDYLKNGAEILDLGCGPGNIASFLTRRAKGYKILGIDLSTEMLEIAKLNAPEQQFMVGDIRYLQLTQKFDGIIASFSLIHLDNKETTELLINCYNLLNDEGYLYISFMSGGLPGFETTNFSDGRIYFNYLIPEEVTIFLEKIGFVILLKQYRDYQRTTELVIRDVVMIVQKNNNKSKKGD